MTDYSPVYWHRVRTAPPPPVPMRMFETSYECDDDDDPWRNDTSLLHHNVREPSPCMIVMDSMRHVIRWIIVS